MSTLPASISLAPINLSNWPQILSNVTTVAGEIVVVSFGVLPSSSFEHREAEKPQKRVGSEQTCYEPAKPKQDPNGTFFVLFAVGNVEMDHESVHA